MLLADWKFDTEVVESEVLYYSPEATKVLPLVTLIMGTSENGCHMRVLQVV